MRTRKTAAGPCEYPTAPQRAQRRSVERYFLGRLIPFHILRRTVIPMARKTPAKESIPPTLPPQRAIELLRRQLDQFDTINALRSDDPEVKKWKTTTEGILNGAFGQQHGEPHDLTSSFTQYYGSRVRRRKWTGPCRFRNSQTSASRSFVKPAERLKHTQPRSAITSL
jgi:hypothetical protein